MALHKNGVFCISYVVKRNSQINHPFSLKKNPHISFLDTYLSKGTNVVTNTDTFIPRVSTVLFTSTRYENIEPLYNEWVYKEMVLYTKRNLLRHENKIVIYSKMNWIVVYHVKVNQTLKKEYYIFLHI